MTRNLSRARTRRPGFHRALTTAVVLGTLAGGLGGHASASAGTVPTMCIPNPTFSDQRLKTTYDQWGGRGGKLGCAVRNAAISPDGKALVMDFQGGTITFRNQDIPPTVMLAQIRDEWYAIGGGTGRSPVGYPRSNTFALGTPAGELGMANEFETGDIYFAPSTGAHEVHGSIRTFHREHFAEMGFPTSDEQDFTEGGRMNAFQVGAAYWWSDTGVIHVPRNLVVRYSGFIPYKKTNDQFLSDDDEVYATVGAITPRTDPQHPTIWQSEVYQDVDPGDVKVSNIELYRGAPEGITISAVLMEEDGGFSGEIKRIVEDTLKKKMPEIKDALRGVPLVGPLLALAAEPVLKAVVPALVSLVSDALGQRDDVIGSEIIPVSAKQMVVYSSQGSRNEPGPLKWKFRTGPMNGKGGEYRMFFMVYNESA